MDDKRLNPQGQEPSPTHAVVAVFYEDDRVENAVSRLREIGFEGIDVDSPKTDPFLEPHAVKPANRGVLDGAATGLITGAVVGAVFGLLMGIGSLPTMSFGVVKDILEGTLVGAVVGGLALAALGCVAGWRMSANPKLAFEPDSGKPAILVCVDAGRRDEEAKSVLIESGGDLGPNNAADGQMP